MGSKGCVLVITKQKQLECRIIISHGRTDLKTEVGMYDPLTMRYEPLGAHGPSQREIDRVVRDLQASMERAEHLVTFSEVRNRWSLASENADRRPPIVR